MIYSSYNYPYCPTNIICFTGDDISSNMIEQCFKIDENFFEEKYIYDREKVKKWIKKYSDLCFIFYDLKANKVIGYNFLVILSMQAYESYLRGEISYFTIGANQFVNDKNNVQGALLYLSSAYAPNLNISLMSKLVQNAMTDLIIGRRLDYNIVIKKYFLDAVCQFDEEYAKFMKLPFVKQTAYGSKIYAGDFNPRTFFPEAVNYDILNTIYNRN